MCTDPASLTISWTAKSVSSAKQQSKVSSVQTANLSLILFRQSTKLWTLIRLSSVDLFICTFLVITYFSIIVNLFVKNSNFILSFVFCVKCSLLLFIATLVFLGTNLTMFYLFYSQLFYSWKYVWFLFELAKFGFEVIFFFDICY